MAGVDVGQAVVALALVAGDALFGVPLGGAEVTAETERPPAEMVGLDQEPVVVHALGQRENAARVVARRPDVAGDHVVLAVASQGHEQPADVIDPFADFGGTRESRRHIPIAKAPRWHQAHAEGVLQRDFAAMARHRLGQGGEQLQALAQMALGLDMGRTLHRALAGLEPVIDRLFDAAGLGVVVGEQLGLGDFGKLRFEDIGDARVMALPPAAAPASRTVFVISSTNSGTPSVRTTISSMTSAGSGAAPATWVARRAQVRASSRLSASNVTCRSPVHAGVNFERKLVMMSTLRSGARATVKSISSREVGSIQCASSK